MERGCMPACTRPTLLPSSGGTGSCSVTSAKPHLAYEPKLPGLMTSQLAQFLAIEAVGLEFYAAILEKPARADAAQGDE